MDADATIKELEKIESGLWILVGGCILVVGSAANVLVICVVSCRPAVRQGANGLHLVCLALADMGVLYTGLLRHLLLYATDFNIRDSSVVACKVHLFATYVATQMAAWALIHLTVERLGAVYLAHRVHLVFAIEHARIALLVNIILIALLNTPYLCTFTLVSVGNETKCDIEERWQTMSDALDWTHIAVASFAPFVTMAMANSAIVYKLYKDKRSGAPRRTSGRRGDPSCLLLVVTSTFILTTAPWSIFIAVVNHFDLLVDVGSKDLSRLYLLGTSLALLSYVNHVLNFFLYCMMGSRFRAEFVNLIRRNRVSPWSTESRSGTLKRSTRTPQPQSHFAETSQQRTP
jgi:hypothetical protein